MAASVVARLVSKAFVFEALLALSGFQYLRNLLMFGVRASKGVRLFYNRIALSVQVFQQAF